MDTDVRTATIPTAPPMRVPGEPWAPPPAPATPDGPADGADPLPGPARRPGRGRNAGVVLAALVAGVGGGYVAGGLAADGATTTTQVAIPTAIETTGGGIDVAAVVSSVQPSVVSIETVVETRYGPFSQVGRGAGTGIVLDTDGHVLTNAHVVDGAQEVTITVAGESSPRSATVIGGDRSRDLAVLRVDDPTGLVPAAIGDSDAVAVGDPVVAIGNALGLEGGPTVTQGIISALDRSISTNSGGTLSGLLQTDTAISSGNSGGPLVDADGRVIGINTAVAGSGGGVQASNVGFVIPIADAVAFAQQVIAAG